MRFGGPDRASCRPFAAVILAAGTAANGVSLTLLGVIVYPKLRNEHP